MLRNFMYRKYDQNSLGNASLLDKWVCSLQMQSKILYNPQPTIHFPVINQEYTRKKTVAVIQVPTISFLVLDCHHLGLS